MLAFLLRYEGRRRVESRLPNGRPGVKMQKAAEGRP